MDDSAKKTQNSQLKTFVKVKKNMNSSGSGTFLVAVDCEYVDDDVR